MLGKLMKYEWKATWKLLLAANLLTVVMSLLAWCMVNVFDDVPSYSSGFQMIDFVTVMVVLTYVMSMFVVYVGTAIYLIHRFYTSTYGDQGYLLHTLPVDTHHIIVAKVLVSAIWMLINALLMGLSVLLLFSSSEDVFISMMEGMVDAIEFLGAEKVTAFTVLMTFVAYVFSVFAKVLKVGACISLGQLSSNHKLMLSFAWYVVIYLVERFFQVIYWAIRAAFEDRFSYVDSFSYMGGSWETTLLAGIVSCVVFYVLTWYVMSRKLNLD